MMHNECILITGKENMSKKAFYEIEQKQEFTSRRVDLKSLITFKTFLRFNKLNLAFEMLKLGFIKCQATERKSLKVDENPTKSF
jgi:hypothetical protein